MYLFQTLTNGYIDIGDGEGAQYSFAFGHDGVQDGHLKKVGSHWNLWDIEGLIIWSENEKLPTGWSNNLELPTPDDEPDF
jgi:hypothetical protein